VPDTSIFLPPGGGERIDNPLGGTITFKARAGQTNGALTVFEADNEPGTGPPYHVHRGLDELIYVLDGALRVRLGERVENATTGACVFIPRGIPHTWEGAGHTPVRFLALLTPAGLETFFERTATAGSGADGEAFSRFGGDDLEVLGPPLATSHPT
jgi:quercetin dioxygenase-like cupin family protein